MEKHNFDDIDELLKRERGKAEGFVKRAFNRICNFIGNTLWAILFLSLIGVVWSQL